MADSPLERAQQLITSILSPDGAATANAINLGEKSVKDYRPILGMGNDDKPLAPAELQKRISQIQAGEKELPKGIDLATAGEGPYAQNPYVIAVKAAESAEFTRDFFSNATKNVDVLARTDPNLSNEAQNNSSLWERAAKGLQWLSAHTGSKADPSAIGNKIHQTADQPAQQPAAIPLQPAAAVQPAVIAAAAQPQLAPAKLGF